MTHEAAAAILGMTAVTFGVRVAGFLLASRLPQTGRGARWLRRIPGAVLAAIVAPAILTGGSSEAFAAAVTALAAILTRNLFAAMAAGVATVWAMRSAFGMG